MRHLNQREKAGRTITITELTKPLADQLMKDIYFGGSDVLKLGLKNDILTSVGLLPNVNRLVAYHNKDRMAIGFLCLKETTKQLYTIEKAYVHPNYRRMGVATYLIDNAISIAKQKSAKKISLNVYTDNTDAIKLYEKQGFRAVGNNLLGQGFLSDNPPSRIFKRLIKGQGPLTRLAMKKEDRLCELQLNTKNKEVIFRIYRDCMKQEWLNFFEVNSNNLINEPRHVWQPVFFKNVLLNDQMNFFALIYHKPFSSKATVEIYSTSKDVFPSMMGRLLRVLSNMGISFAQIACFDQAAFDWFGEKGAASLGSMMTFDFITMGRIL